MGVEADGRVFELRGTRLAAVSMVSVGDLELEIMSQSDELLVVRVPDALEAGTYDLLITSDSGMLTAQDGISIGKSVAESIQQEGASGWTSLKGKYVKVYAKNIVGAGKVQFMHEGREFAWVRAVDQTNPKLRAANGSYYLVRTYVLKPGKNAFEIYLDGERVWRAAYTQR